MEQGEEVDSSYHYYDNLRGKINSRILTELVSHVYLSKLNCKCNKLVHDLTRRLNSEIEWPHFIGKILWPKFY